MCSWASLAPALYQNFGTQIGEVATGRVRRLVAIPAPGFPQQVRVYGRNHFLPCEASSGSSGQEAVSPWEARVANGQRQRWLERRERWPFPVRQGPRPPRQDLGVLWPRAAALLRITQGWQTNHQYERVHLLLARVGPLRQVAEGMFWRRCHCAPGSRS